jgi:hypothetical protein
MTAHSAARRAPGKRFVRGAATAGGGGLSVQATGLRLSANAEGDNLSFSSSKKSIVCSFKGILFDAMTMAFRLSHAA